MLLRGVRPPLPRSFGVLHHYGLNNGCSTVKLPVVRVKGMNKEDGEKLVSKKIRMDDHRLPYYTMDSEDLEQLNYFYPEEKFMTFRDDKNQVIEIYYDDKVILQRIQQSAQALALTVPKYLGPVKFKSWCRNILQHASVRSMNYSSSVGREVLAWLYHSQCCVKTEDIPDFVRFARSLTFDGFEGFFESKGIYPPDGGHKGVVIFYHCGRIPRKKVDSGYHLFGGLDVPSTFFVVENEGSVVDDDLERWNWYNKSMTKCPTFKVSLAQEGAWESFDSFIKWVEYLAWRGKPWNLETPDKTLKMQVMSRNGQKGIAKVHSMLNAEQLGRCRLRSPYRCFLNRMRSHQKLRRKASNASSFVVDEDDDQEEERLFTIMGDDLQVLQEFLQLLESKGDDRSSIEWCVLKLPYTYLKSILPMERMVWYDPIDREVYVARSSTHDMVKFITSLQHMKPGILDFEKEFHIFEAAPLQALSLAKSSYFLS